MDFFEQEAHAKRQTRRLLWLFSLAVLAVVLLAYLIFASLIWLFQHPELPERRWDPFFLLGTAIFFYGDALIHPLQFLTTIWSLQLLCWSTLGTLVLIAAGCYYKMRLLAAGASRIGTSAGLDIVSAMVADESTPLAAG